MMRRVCRGVITFIFAIGTVLRRPRARASPACSPSSSHHFFIPATLQDFTPPFFSDLVKLGVRFGRVSSCLQFWILFNFWGFCPIL
jgi:hypothetical protein